MEAIAENQNIIIFLLTEKTTAVILIPTVILGIFLAAIYILRCCKHKMKVEEATIVHCFLMSAGIVGGFLLAATAALGAVMPEIADIQHRVHELNIYIIIGGVTVIVTFCKQARSHVFFDTPSKEYLNSVNEKDFNDNNK